MKLIRKIHLFLSIPFGLMISLICLTGAMLVFEEEVSHSLQRELYYVPLIGKTTLSEQELTDIVTATLPDSVSVTGVQKFDDPARTWRVALSKPHKAAVFVDPYTGHIAGRYKRLAFFNFNFKMHRWLLDVSKPGSKSPTLGKLVVGYSTLAFVFILISGMALWLPMARRNAKMNFRIVLNRGKFLFWRSTHVAGGAYFFIFLLLMALTGLTWSFGWMQELASNLLGPDPKAVQKLIYSLHTGSFGGLLTKTIWFAVALFGASLPFTGYYLWLRKKLRK